MSDWQGIETAPRDGTEFVCGWFFQGRFVQDLAKFYTPPDGKTKIIQPRYRHVLQPSVWAPIPSPPNPGKQSGEANEPPHD